MICGQLSFAEVVKKPHIELELISDVTSIQPGQSFWLVLRAKMDDHWHIYWKNPGDSGKETTFNWELPKGFKAEPMQWPYPKKLIEGEGEILLAVYGYEGEVYFLKRVTAPTNLPAGKELSFKVTPEWLICYKECLPPTSATISLGLPVNRTTAEKSKWVNTITKAINQIPLSKSQWKVNAGFKNKKIYIQLIQPSNYANTLQNIVFIPDKQEIIQGNKGQVVKKTKDGYLIEIPQFNDTKTPPKEVNGIIVADKILSEDRKALSIQSKINTTMKIPDGNVIAQAEKKHNTTNESTSKTEKHSKTIENVKITWEDFSLNKLKEYREKNVPVFIDFTAAWCLSCQYNKLGALKSSKFARKLKEHGIISIRADWTKYDKVIAGELKNLGRAGVPVYVFFYGNKHNKKIVLPEILSESMLLEAVQNVSQGKTTNSYLQQKNYDLWLILLFSLGGGLILNIMPCVFPVLSIKILNFVEQAGEDKQKIKLHGFIYSAGVILSFLALAAVIIIASSWGKSYGMGFQLQSAPFVICLTAVLFLFGLNMLGVFEIGISLTKAGQTSSNTSGLVNSFFTGVLAVVVGAPCLGPFTGVATGVALIDPVWWKTSLIFTFLGIGMAIPYLILSIYPSLLRFLPKPGRWMESFKQSMGFLLLSAVILLIWLFGTLTNNFSVFILLTALLIIGISAWIYGRWGTIVQSFNTRSIARIIALLLLIGGLALALLKTEKASDGSPPSLKESKISQAQSS